jgi:hypothetical protein
MYYECSRVGGGSTKIIKYCIKYQTGLTRAKFNEIGNSGGDVLQLALLKFRTHCNGVTRRNRRRKKKKRTGASKEVSPRGHKFLRISQTLGKVAR